MYNLLNTLNNISKFMPLNFEEMQELFKIEEALIKQIRKDIKKTGTSPILSLQNEEGLFLGHIAVKLNLNKLANEILKYKEACNKDNSGRTMADYSVICGNDYIAIHSLNNEVLVKTKNNNTYFFMPLNINPNVKLINTIINKYPQYLKLTDNFKEHLGFYCVRHGLTKQANEIIINHPEIAKLKNLSGDTMGHIAFDELNNSVLRTWLNNKELRRIQNRFGQNLLHLLAIENRNKKLLSCYINDKVAMTQQDYLKNTPAHYIYSNNNIPIAHQCLTIPNIFEIKNNKDQTILDLARKNNSIVQIANFSPSKN